MRTLTHKQASGAGTGGVKCGCCCHHTHTFCPMELSPKLTPSFKLDSCLQICSKDASFPSPDPVATSF